MKPSKLRRRTLLIGAVLLLLFALALFIPHKGSPASECLSVYIESFTNLPGMQQRMACLVITNHSSSTFRIYGVATFVGPLPAQTSKAKRSVEDGFWLVTAWSSSRSLIMAPTNGQEWRGLVAAGPDRSLHEVGRSLLNARSDTIKGMASLLMPTFRAEELYTSARTN